MAQRDDDAPLVEPRGPEAEPSRDRILVAALDVFAGRGFEGTTTAEIARRAGVTQPLVHYHFDSKEALWRAAVERALLGIADAFDGVLGELADLDTLAQMKVIVRRFVRFTAAHPELARIVAHEGVQGGPRLDWLLGHDVAGAFAGFADLYERAVAEGRAKPLPVEHVTASLVAAAAHVFMVRATMRQLYGIDTTDPAFVEAHADTVVELFFHGLVAPEAGGVAVGAGNGRSVGG